MEGVRPFPEDLEYIQLTNEVVKGNGRRIEAILSRGVSVDGCIRLRPITAAAFFRQNEMVKLLIKHGADLNLPMQNDRDQVTVCSAYLPFTGEAPLHVASYAKGIDLIRILLRAGADPNARTTEGSHRSWPCSRGRRAALGVRLPKLWSERGAI